MLAALRKGLCSVPCFEVASTPDTPIARAMTTAASQPISRGVFSITMLIATMVALSASVGVVSAAGGGSDLAMLVGGLAVLAGLASLATLVGPPLLPNEYWGMAVLAVSGARTMLALGAMMVLIEFAGFERRAVVFGVLSGTAILMIAEAAAAVILLNKRERDHAALRSVP